MGASYHQFCPVAKAMEMLDERWTMLIIRELACGSAHFNEIHRGVPRISPALLTKRLQQLTHAGIIRKTEHDQQAGYALTKAGWELQPVLDAIGTWGARWIGELGDEDLDPKLLLWDMHRHIDRDAVPTGRTVVKFVFPDLSPHLRTWWLVITDDDADVCDADPEYPVTVTAAAPLRTMTRIWRGDLPWLTALSTHDLTVQGPTAACRALPGWFTLSTFAAVTRPDRSVASA